MSVAPPNAGPHFVGPAWPCPYCGRQHRMYGALLADVETGEWHTCPFDTATRVGPMVIDGEFAFFDYRPKSGAA
jgi:hypothetical protein